MESRGRVRVVLFLFLGLNTIAAGNSGAVPAAPAASSRPSSIEVSSNPADHVGRKYWVRGQIFNLDSGKCGDGSKYRSTFKVKAGQSFTVTDLVEKIPYSDHSGYWSGFNFYFDDGSWACIDTRFFKFSKDSLSEKNPAEKYIGKRYWVKYDWASKDYRKGTCDSPREQYSAKIRESFIVKKYIPTLSYKEKIEVQFDNGEIVCADASEYGVTDKDPAIHEKELVLEAESEGIKKGAVLWLKYPTMDLPGLTKLKVMGVEGFMDEIIVTFSSTDHGTFTHRFGPISSLTDAVYFKLPKHLTKLSKKVATAIDRRQVLVGMTSAEAIASWGRPTEINRSGGKWGVHEQWVYDGSYLYFENGKLRSWQD